MNPVGVKRWGRRKGSGDAAMARVLLGFKHRMVPIPWFLFTRLLPREAKKTKRVLGGLDDEHRRVHHFVVKKLPGLARPMPPDFIAEHNALAFNAGT